MVSNKEIINKIGSIITDIADQYEYLSKNLEDVNELEMELFMANATFLADYIAILQRLVKSSGYVVTKGQDQKQKSPEASTSRHPQRADQQLDKEHPNKITTNKEPIGGVPEIHVEFENWKQGLVDEKVISFDFDKKVLEELYDRPLTPAEKQVIDQKMKKGESSHATHPTKADDVAKHSRDVFSKYHAAVKITSQPEFQLKDMTAKTDRADTLANKKQTIKDVHKRTTTSRFGKHPGKNLKALINLNDKLLFIKDLFGGYSLAYGEAIEQLNKFDDFEAAEHFLKVNYSKKNNWADKQATVDKIYEILRNKF